MCAASKQRLITYTNFVVIVIVIVVKQVIIVDFTDFVCAVIIDEL